MTTPHLILLSAGGTGGHMTPAIALAGDLLSRGFRVEIMTDPRGQKFSGLFGGLPMHVIRSGTLPSGILGKIKGAFNLALGAIQAFAAVRRLRPAVVIGFGGYPSVPGVWAAQRLGIPTIIHEQNAVIGKANAFLAPSASRIALSWTNVQGLDNAEKQKAVVTGNPVRAEIAALYHQPYPALQPDGKIRILVMGGSLGARVFTDVVPAALTRLSPEYRKRLYILQQCRAEDLEQVRAAYTSSTIECELAPFFDDVPQQLAKAHLIIGRSGASTVSEVTAAGRPAIFVPYPHHKDQQQKMNADSVADSGGAWVMAESGFTPDTLLARVETFLHNPEILFRAAEKSRACGKPDAARRLGNLVTVVVSGWKNEAEVDKSI
jgi:UDP-N-acetylglucosamine--N-acetylmuramyl-(pentapeptide) pyrophosphoryl-undecaprenol N-acetylglucosamine transferase